MLLESHSVVALVNVDGVLSGHYLADGRIALLLATRLCWAQCGKPVSLSDVSAGMLASPLVSQRSCPH